MADLGRGVFSLETDSSKFNKGIDAAEQKTGKLGGALGKLGGIGRVAGGVMAGTVVGALSDAARAAVDDEVSVLGLQKAVENSGVAWEDYSESIDAAIKKGQSLAFSDDQTRAGMQALTESTGSVEEAMKRLPIAMDFARAKGISLEQASKLLGRVSDENTKALKRYGVVLEDGADATAVLAAVQQKFGGQAEVYGNSTKGSIDKMRDSIDEWKESIGASLGPAMGFVSVMPGLRDGAHLLGGALGGLSKVIKLTFIPSLIAMLVPFAPVILVLGAVALAVIALKWAWDNNLGDIQGKTAAVFKALVGIIGGAIRGVIGFINGFIDKYNAVAGVLKLPLIGRIDVNLSGLDDAERNLDALTRPRSVQVYLDTQERLEHRGLTGEIAAASGFHGLVTRPTRFLVGERGPEMVSVTPRGESPGITVAPAITLNYSGDGGAGVASRLAQDVIDITTEQLRQQFRRIGMAV